MASGEGRSNRLSRRRAVNGMREPFLEPQDAFLGVFEDEDGPIGLNRERGH
jgi:hypothetical protein